MIKFIALIPSYNRSSILKKTLKSICFKKSIDSIALVIQYDNPTEEKNYKELLKNLNDYCEKEVIAIQYNKPIGSAKSRKIGLELISQLFSRSYGVMILEDDFILPGGEDIFKIIRHDFELSSKIGCVIGKVVDLRKRKIDPDFYISNPTLATSLTKATGYVFVTKPKHDTMMRTIFGPQFMTVRLSLVKGGVNYDECYLGTGFREETDLQMQIFTNGYVSLYDSRIKVYHFALEYGGNRAINAVTSRSYWKARNHIRFLRKYFRDKKKIYYMMMSSMLLTLYCPIAFPWILRGINEGYKK